MVGWSIALDVLTKPSTLVPLPGPSADVRRVPRWRPLGRPGAIIGSGRRLAKRFSAAGRKLVVLVGRPILYPVLDEEYATRIARDRKTGDAASGHAGRVTGFRVPADCLTRYEIRTVGRGRRHAERRIPADDLADFDASLVCAIEVVAELHGPPDGRR
jgi:hypothetical protein